MKISTYLLAAGLLCGAAPLGAQAPAAAIILDDSPGTALGMVEEPPPATPRRQLLSKAQKDKLIARAQDEAEKAFAKESANRPDRTAPAGWCTIKAVPGQVRCDLGAALAILSRDSILLPGHRFVVAAFLGKSTAGFGIAWELRRYVAPVEGEKRPMRVFLGPVFATPWADGAQLKFNLGFGAAASIP